MQKYALLVYDFSKFRAEANNEVNLGDYVQSLAAKQFLPQVDAYLEREHLNEAIQEEVNCIMNGWYMHGNNWPPHPKINPLFVSFHINSKAEHILLSENSLEYLKQHQPIGCRDSRTAKLLNDRGVDAYFSNCMTLTLGNEYATEESSGEIIFADPYIYENLFGKIIRKLRRILGFGFNENLTKKKIQNRYKDVLSSAFLNNFSVTTQIEKIPSKYNHEEYFKQAEELLKRYARAKVVITSRIHCALPCLGMGTPVIYIHSQRENEEHNSRLDGILELFDNIIYVNKNKIRSSKSFSSPDQIKNADKHKMYAESLIEKVQRFIQSTK
ncbi:MAG: polysaccharide pyruvyl transferase family protein [Flavobacteriaceae bacterium]|jgi:hypothetical protein|nr:polysaccharide pyruvyl transferase family protein [Flavobacteriaceae bacterium]